MHKRRSFRLGWFLTGDEGQARELGSRWRGRDPRRLTPCPEPVSPVPSQDGRERSRSMRSFALTVPLLESYSLEMCLR